MQKVKPVGTVLIMPVWLTATMFNLGVWTLVALFFATQLYAYETSLGIAANLWEILRSALLEWYLWAAATPLIWRLAGLVAIESTAWQKPVALHLCTSFLFAFAHIALHATLHLLSQPLLVPHLWARPEIFSAVFWKLAVRLTTDILHLNLITYWLIVGAAHLVRARRTASEREVRASVLESQLARAELAALKMQLQPHFLFNTLNAVVALVHQNPDAAEQVVTRLSRFLRLTLDTAHQEKLPLWQEIEFIETYLEIEQVRFPRLNVSINLHPETLSALVPSLVLQPLVENAIKHGISNRSRSGCLLVCSELEGSMLKILITDDGAGLSTPATEGIGISNTRLRLRQLYGERQQFTLSAASEYGTVACLTLPFEQGTHYALDVLGGSELRETNHASS